MRTEEEIMMRCKLILDQLDVVLLVEKSSSPTATYDMIIAATGNIETAKAARWLAVLRRDYPSCYAELTHNILCHVPKNTAMKGEGDEKDLRS